MERVRIDNNSFYIISLVFFLLFFPFTSVSKAKLIVISNQMNEITRPDSLNIPDSIILTLTANYSYVGEFSDGMILVAKRDEKSGKDLIGYANNNGIEIIKPVYSGGQNFHEGMAAVMIGEYPNEKWGFINKTGKIIIEPRYTVVEKFYEGFAAVAIGDFENRSWGFINYSGDEIVKPQYDQVGYFSDGLAVVYKIDKRNKKDPFYTNVLGYINAEGKLVVPITYDRITPSYSEDNESDPILSSFYDGIAFVKSGNLIGAIDKTGQFILKPKFQEISDGNIDNPNRFNEGLLAVKVKGKWGFIDKNFDEVVKPEYDKVEDFENGLSIVQKGGKDVVVFEMAVERIGSKYGVIDKAGNILVPLKYTKIRRTREGEFEAYEGGKEVLDESKEEYIYYKGGKWIKLTFNKQ